MRNFLLGYLFTRSLVGERAARTATLVVILGVALFLLALSGSFFDLFAKSFFKGVEDGLRQWEHPHGVKRESHRVGKDLVPSRSQRNIAVGEVSDLKR